MDTQERMEYVQDVIDRLLYLRDEKLTEYQHYLDVLKDVYPIDVKMENGIRVYHTKNESKWQDQMTCGNVQVVHAHKDATICGSRITYVKGATRICQGAESVAQRTQNK